MSEVRTRAELEAEIERAQGEIDRWEPDPDDYTEQYDEMLRECTGDGSGDIHIGSLTYDVAYALKELDPTAYRCGMVDWLDGEQREGIIRPDELESELAELEDELADLGDEDEDDGEGAL